MVMESKTRRISSRNKDLTIEVLKDEISYNPNTGLFHWKKTKSGRSKKEAGYIANDGYKLIMINAILYQAHRLAWFYINGTMPPKRSLDHINRIRSDNRIKNLRPCLEYQNGHNKRLPSNNSSGLKGIRFKKNRWEVSCMVNNKRKYLGRYEKKSDAINAYNSYAYKLVGEFFTKQRRTKK